MRGHRNACDCVTHLVSLNKVFFAAVGNENRLSKKEITYERPVYDRRTIEEGGCWGQAEGALRGSVL